MGKSGGFTGCYSLFKRKYPVSLIIINDNKLRLVVMPAFCFYKYVAVNKYEPCCRLCGVKLIHTMFSSQGSVSFYHSEFVGLLVEQHKTDTVQ